MKKYYLFLILYLLSVTQIMAKEAVGTITALKGEVFILHKEGNKKESAGENSSVFQNDVIETKDGARLKILFNDDTILRLGPNSQLEINEHVYNPQTDTRQAVYKMAKGTVRAMVAKSFSGAGSKLEIHTPTAVAASRDTSFLVSATGVVICFEGRVEVSNSGITGSVMLAPQMMTTVMANKPPVTPSKFSDSQIKKFIQETEINESGSSAKLKTNTESQKDNPGPKVTFSVETISKPVINFIKSGGLDLVIKKVEGNSRIGGVINSVPVTNTEPPTPKKVPVTIKLKLPEKK